MSKFNLYLVRGDWDVRNGTYISTHKTRQLAMKKLMADAKKWVAKVYYTRETPVTDKVTIIDFGHYTKFYGIEEVEDENI